jgi:lipopolysaccharide/colanic/teichoic acid biosynthesis glycosyltransferase
MTRLFDVIVATILLVILSPFLVVIAAAVLTSGSPVLYRATRVGRFGREFTLYKFRTMRTAASGPPITQKNDLRVTRVGRVLRRFKLDELPQLINVIKGEMALVGPRPEDPRYVTMYNDEQKRVLQVRPGMTSEVSLAFRREEDLISGPDWEQTYVRELMPRKLEGELRYLEHRTLLTDARVLLRTMHTIFRK